MDHLQFDFYGVGVRVESNEQDFLSAVELDFSYFLGNAGHPSLELTLTNSKPDYERLPELTCSFATPRNICFSDGRFTYIDYFGQGLNIYDKQANHKGRRNFLFADGHVERPPEQYVHVLVDKDNRRRVELQLEEKPFQ